MLAQKQESEACGHDVGKSSAAVKVQGRLETKDGCNFFIRAVEGMSEDEKRKMTLATSPHMKVSSTISIPSKYKCDQHARCA